MASPSRARFLGTLVSALVALACHSVSAQDNPMPQSYAVEWILPSGVSGKAFAVNDSGDATGWYYGSSSSSYPSYVFSGGTLWDFPTLGINGSVGSINSQGQAVGSLKTPSGEVAMVFQNGQAETIEALETYNYGIDINESGQVLGVSIRSASNFAWLVEGDRLTEIGPYSALDLNNRGDVLLTKDGWESFVWRAGVLTPLGPVGVPGVNAFQPEFPKAINDHGIIVGDAEWKPYLYDGAFGAEFPTSMDLIVQPISINNSEQIVGGSAFLHNRTVYRLADLIDFGLGSEIPASLHGWDISENGTIAGYAYFATAPNYRAFVARPRTQPATGKTAPPVFSKGSGYYEKEFRAELSCATPNARIHYTLDGTVPTEASSQYSQPLRLTGSARLSARCFANGLAPGPVGTALIQIYQPRPQPPTITGMPSRDGRSVKVSFRSAERGERIWYTIYGDGFVISRWAGNKPLILQHNARITAETHRKGATPSEPAEATFTVQGEGVQVARPVVTPGAGTYSQNLTVKVTCATKGAEILYWIGPANLEVQGTGYNRSIRISGSTTLRVMAVKPGLIPSEEVTVPYVIAPF